MRISLIIVGHQTMKIQNLIFSAFFLLVIAGNIHAASFDCGKAASEIEKIICGNDELSRLDESLNKAYLKALEWKDIKNRIIKSQRQWLKVRNACKDAECLKTAYETRIKELGLSEHGIAILTPPNRSVPSSKPPAKTSISQTAKPTVEVNQTKTEQQPESTPKRPKKSTIDLSINKLLLQSAEKGHLEQVKALLKKGADVNARDTNGQTALMAAAGRGHLEMVKLLIDKGADVNANDENGQTALMGAAVSGQLQIVEFLNDKGSNVKAKNKHVPTVVMAAEWGKNYDIVRLLIDKGADVNAKAKNGDTALKLAKTKGHTRIVELLKAQGANE
jgi:uncharacterized protein